MSRLAYVVAVVLFLFAAFAPTDFRLAPLDLVALGLAAFALGHVLPD